MNRFDSGCFETHNAADLEMAPYQRSNYVGSMRTKRSDTIKSGRKQSKRTISGQRVATSQLNAIRSIGLVCTIIFAVLAIGLCLTFANASASAFKGVGSSIDSLLGFSSNKNTPQSEISTPQSEWKKGSVPYLYQTDPEWADTSYGDGKISDYGCGPTCLSMVYVALTGKTSLPPDEMGRFSEKNGFIEQGITSWRLMSAGAANLGLVPKELGSSESRVRSELESGHPIICSLGPGDFTTSGHFIVISDVNQDGTVNVRDPNSSDRSKKSWQISQILGQTRNLWSFTC